MTPAAASRAASPAAAPRHDRAPHPDLAALRRAGARCRAMARDDLFRACALLSLDREAGAGAYATALFRSLPGLLGGRFRLYAPGDAETSFDEDWLLRLIERMRAGDADSVAFLLAARVPAHARRQIGFLVAGLARSLDTPPESITLSGVKPAPIASQAI